MEYVRPDNYSLEQLPSDNILDNYPSKGVEQYHGLIMLVVVFSGDNIPVVVVLEDTCFPRGVRFIL